VQPNFEIVRVQDIGLTDADDPDILEWASNNDRIIRTHDRATMRHYAYARVALSVLMCGVFVIDDRMPIGEAISEILLVSACSEQSEWKGLVLYFPLRVATQLQRVSRTSSTTLCDSVPGSG
jgi:hypothetical protein